jgi:hypothetical protein
MELVMGSLLRKIILVIIVASAITVLFGCAHSLEAKYGGSAGLGFSLLRDCPRSQPILGVRFSDVKDKYEQSLSESIVDALGHAGCFSRIIQNYPSGKSSESQPVDYILEIKIKTAYSDDAAQNWATQWPGVIVFSTWWNGLLYYLDINTEASISDVKTGKMTQVNSKDRYDIHYSSGARGVFSGSIVGWFVLTGVSFLSALVPTYWDDNMKADTNLKIREEYGKIVAQKVIQALREKGVYVGRKNIPVG